MAKHMADEMRPASVPRIRGVTRSGGVVKPGLDLTVLAVDYDNEKDLKKRWCAAACLR
jgi:hypothetical protein